MCIFPWPDHDGVRQIALDLDDEAALTREAAGTSIVINGLSPADYGRRSWERDVPRFGARAIAISQRLEALLMLPGNVYPVGTTLPAQLDVDTPMRADTHHGRLRLAMERTLQEASERGGLRAVVVRAGDFYGGGPGSWLDLAMLKSIRRGRLILPGDRETAHAWAWLPDLAQAFVRVAAARDRLPPCSTLHFAGHSVTGQDWINALGGDRALTVGRLPWAMLRAGGLVSPTMRSLLEMRYLWQRPHGLVNASLARLIGDEPATPFAMTAAASARALGWVGQAPTVLSRA